jgi:hypothetical protein
MAHREKRLTNLLVLFRWNCGLEVLTHNWVAVDNNMFVGIALSSF